MNDCSLNCQSKEQGVAIVEFAIALVFLVLIVGGSLEWGLNVFVSHVAENLAREGARIGAVLPTLSADDPRVVGAVNQRYQNMAFSAFFPQPPTISVRLAPPDRAVRHLGNGLPCDEEVIVAVEFSFDFMLLEMFGFSNFSLGRSVAMRYQRQPLCM